MIRGSHSIGLVSSLLFHVEFFSADNPLFATASSAIELRTHCNEHIFFLQCSRPLSPGEVGRHSHSILLFLRQFSTVTELLPAMSQILSFGKVHHHNFLGKTHDRSRMRTNLVVVLTLVAFVIEVTFGVRFGSVGKFICLSY